SFGTVISNIVAENGHDARLWMRNAGRVDEVNRQHSNGDYLPGISLCERLRATTDLAEAVTDSAVLFVAVPTSSCREVAAQMATCLQPGTRVVSLTKGIDPTGFRLMSEILAEELPQAAIGVLSGPNLAREIAARQLTASVIASADAALCACVQQLLHCSYF